MNFLELTKARYSVRSFEPRVIEPETLHYVMECTRRRSEPKDHADIDISIAVEHLCLAAAEQGLGTCWVCNFDVTLCRELFGIADPLEPVVLIPIGYPKVNEPGEKNRKAMDEVFVNL